MKIIFLSNYYNHHQKYISEALYRITNKNYFFVETEEMTEERKNLGWGEQDKPEFVVRLNEETCELCQKYIEEADAVILGSAPRKLVEQRLKNNKAVFLYSERIYKKPLKWYMWPVRLLLNYKRFGRHKNLYLLCASAYTARDYALTGTFKNKSFKWGYFPEYKIYEDVDTLIGEKKSSSILWCARFIDWKHPEHAIEVAKRLKNDGYDFNLNMIGVGEMYEDISNQISKLNLKENVRLLGAMNPYEVRAYMEQSEIFLQTSDRQEGWGAVVNEAMNSACAVVASNSIGSAPYLIQNEENGLLYFDDKSANEIYEKVKWLLDNRDKRIKLAKNAYEAISRAWNAENAACRLVELFEKILNKEDALELFKDGPCSKA